MTRIRKYIGTALLTLLPATMYAAEKSSLRGSPASMTRQHNVAVEEELTFARTPASIIAEVEAGTLTELRGNADYEIANVSFAYAVPEVRMLVERLAAQYRAACGEPLVVTSLTRPRSQQPRNAHVLSVHPAGMAIDLRVSTVAACRSWLESTLLSLESVGVLDATLERNPPHYHVAVFPTPYREYVARLEASKPKVAAAAPAPSSQLPVVRAAVPSPPGRSGGMQLWAPIMYTVTCAVAGLAALRRKLR